MTPPCLLLLLVALPGGCLGRSTLIVGALATDSSATDRDNAGGDQANAAPIPWGTWAQGAGLPDCPTGSPVLVVTTTAHELDGGASLADPAAAGATLSFIEALTIAANRAGPDTVLFDASVFAPDSAAEIIIDSVPRLPGLASVCVDARGRHVRLRFAATCGSSCGASVSAGSLLLGLEIDARPGGDNKWNISASQVAGCHLTADTFSSGALSLLGTGTVIGPGNYFETGLYNNNESALVTDSFFTVNPVIRDNYFGYDPRTGTATGFGSLGTGVLAWVPLTVSGNVFAGLTDPVFAGAISEPGDIVFTGNWVGVDKQGQPTLPCQFKTPLSGNTGWVVGPDNVIAYNDIGVEIRSDAYPVRVTANSIYANGTAGIAFNDILGGTGPTPPALTAVTANLVTGTCTEAGQVELFADAQDQGQTYLGSTACTAGVPFNLAVNPPSGRNLTAVLITTAGRTSPFSPPWAVP